MTHWLRNSRLMEGITRWNCLLFYLRTCFRNLAFLKAQQMASYKSIVGVICVIIFPISLYKHLCERLFYFSYFVTVWMYCKTVHLEVADVVRMYTEFSKV